MFGKAITENKRQPDHARDSVWSSSCTAPCNVIKTHSFELSYLCLDEGGFSVINYGNFNHSFCTVLVVEAPATLESLTTL